MPKSKSKKKSAPKNAPNGTGPMELSEGLTGDSCEGFLWLKRVGRLSSKYIKRWCELNDKLLSVYYRKNGKLKEQINIEICIVAQRKKPKSSSFYLEINSDWDQYIFGTKNADDYDMWLNKLKLSSSLHLDMNDGTKTILLKHFSRDGNDMTDNVNWFYSTTTIAPNSNDTEIYDTIQNNKTHDQQSAPQSANHFPESGQINSAH